MISYYDLSSPSIACLAVKRARRVNPKLNNNCLYKGSCADVHASDSDRVLVKETASCLDSLSKGAVDEEYVDEQGRQLKFVSVCTVLEHL